MRIGSKSIAMLAGVLLSLASSARADNSRCAGALLLVPDGSPQVGQLDAAPGPAQSRYFRFVARAGRSYAVMLENLTSPDQQEAIGIAGVTDGCGGPVLPFRDIADFIEPESSDAASVFSCGAVPGAPGPVQGCPFAERVTLIASADADTVFRILQFASSPTRPLGGADFRVRVEETTLFSPYWSTLGGGVTYYRIHNTTHSTCSVTLSLRTDANGTPAGGTSTTTFSLAGNHSVTRTTGVTDLHIGNGQVGHATLLHDCTPGAIQVDAFVANRTGTVQVPVTMAPARQQR